MEKIFLRAKGRAAADWVAARSVALGREYGPDLCHEQRWNHYQRDRPWTNKVVEVIKGIESPRWLPILFRRKPALYRQQELDVLYVMDRRERKVYQRRCLSAVGANDASSDERWKTGL